MKILHLYVCGDERLLLWLSVVPGSVLVCSLCVYRGPLFPLLSWMGEMGKVEREEGHLPLIALPLYLVDLFHQGEVVGRGKAGGYRAKSQAVAGPLVTIASV